MKIFVEMIAYNTGPLIGPAIQSTYDYVDQIIVVDGSAYGPSTDNTARWATDCGPKVTLIQGTFGKGGSWDEAAQRRVYSDVVEWDSDNWFIYQDADEVFYPGDIERLIAHMQEAQPHERYFCYKARHFWMDAHHVISGGVWDGVRWDMANRLIPRLLVMPPDEKRVYLEDVTYNHYGPALPKARRQFRALQYLHRGDYHGRNWMAGGEGFRPSQDREFLEFFNEWEVTRGESGEQVVTPFTGEHPKGVLEALDGTRKEG